MNRQERRGTYSVKEVAERFGCSKNHIYDLIARGEFPGVIHLGRKIVISQKVIDEMLEPSEANATSLGG